jgi:hypothetical protein
MDIRIAGRIVWRLERATKSMEDERITFTLAREPQGGQVVCVSSLQFDRNSINAAVGERVILFGDWVVDKSTGSVAGFLFERAQKFEDLPVG